MSIFSTLTQPATQTPEGIVYSSQQLFRVICQGNGREEGHTNYLTDQISIQLVRHYTLALLIPGIQSLRLNTTTVG